MLSKEYGFQYNRGTHGVLKAPVRQYTLCAFFVKNPLAFLEPLCLREERVAGEIFVGGDGPQLMAVAFRYGSEVVIFPGDAE